MTEQEAAMLAYYENLKRNTPPEPPKVVITVRPPKLSKRAKLIASFKVERCAMEEYFACAPPAKPTLASILTDISRQYGVTEHGIKSKCRVNWIANIRQEFYYRAAKETLHYYTVIGRFCGGRDHSTVLYGVSAYCLRTGLEHPRDPRDDLAERANARKLQQYRRYRYRDVLSELSSQDEAQACS